MLEICPHLSVKLLSAKQEIRKNLPNGVLDSSNNQAGYNSSALYTELIIFLARHTLKKIVQLDCCILSDLL